MAGVKTTHRDYDKRVKQWKRCRDAAEGEDAVKAGGKAYLRKFEGESESEYQERLCEASFLNATWRTISGLNGLAFRKVPKRNLPVILEGYAKDITMTGINLDAFAEQNVEEILEVGRVGLLVDHPPMPEKVRSISVDVAERNGLRPFLRAYPAESIRNWKFRMVANKWSLCQVVLAESAEVAKDEFTTEIVDRYRVLDLDGSGFYRQRVFEVVDGKDVQIGDDVYPAINGKPLTFIPFAILGRNGMGDAIDAPPLIDLVDRNLKHYRVSALLDNGLMFASAPTMVVRGYHDDSQPFYVGGSRAIVLPDPNSSVEYAELKGDSIPAVERRLAELKQEMAGLGAQTLVESSKRERTATEAVLDTTGENSILARITIAASEAIEWALRIMAEWAGASGDVEYEISRDFLPAGVSAQDLTAYMSAVQQGLMSEREFYEILQRGDVVDAQKDFETHEEEIGQMALPAPNPMQGSMAA